MESYDIVKKIVKAMDDKKARDIKVLKIGHLTTLADYFVICSGGSSTQISAISDEIHESLSKEGLLPKGREGRDTANWVLLDYIGVITHIFSEESREFYSIERLWSDADIVDVDELIK